MPKETISGFSPEEKQKQKEREKFEEETKAQIKKLKGRKLLPEGQVKIKNFNKSQIKKLKSGFMKEQIKFEQPNNQEKLKEFWKKNEPEIKQKISLLLETERPKLYENERKKQSYEKGFLAREEKFTKKIINALYEQDPEKEGMLLFDIDQTLGTFKFENKKLNKPERTILRPSVMPLFELIKKDFPKFQIGFWTTRSALENQLEDENHLKPMSRFINKELLLSTKNMPQDVEYVPNKGRELKDYLEKRSCIDVKLLPKDEEEFNLFNLRIDTNSTMKLILLEKLQKQFPESEIIAVDDFSFPVKYLKNGIHLENDSLFDI